MTTHTLEVGKAVCVYVVMQCDALSRLFSSLFLDDDDNETRPLHKCEGVG